MHFGFIGEFNALLGQLDEIRITDRILPEDWLRADARTHRTPSNAILDVGAPEPIPCP